MCVEYTGLSWWLVVKSPPANTGDSRFLGLEGSPEEGNVNALQYLAWEIPRTEDPGRLQSIGLKTVRCNLTTEHAHRSRD